MSHGETSHGTPESEATEQSSDAGEEGGLVSTVRSDVGAQARSGVLAGVLGGASVFQGIRSLESGQRARGVRRMAVGGALLAVAAVQRRVRGDGAGTSIDVDQSDVVDTAPDIDAVADSESGPDHASGDEAAEVVDTGPDIDDVEPDTGGGSESPTGAGPESEGERESAAEQEGETGGQVETEEAAGSEAESDASSETESDAAAVEYDRLGSAAFDEHSGEVPVPQEAFNRELLALDAEAVWGIRDDDGVVVSQLYDPIADGEGVRYVASTQIDEERVLTVPDGVLDHWDDVSGGPMAVESGDDIVFAASDDLADDEQLLVVPAAWADDVLGDGE